MMAGRESLATERWRLTKNASVTYPDAWLWCDRDGLLFVGSDVPDHMLPIARAPWPRLYRAMKGLAPSHRVHSVSAVPGVYEAGEDAGAALDAIFAFRTRLLAALADPLADVQDVGREAG